MPLYIYITIEEQDNFQNFFTYRSYEIILNFRCLLPYLATDNYPAFVAQIIFRAVYVKFLLTAEPRNDNLPNLGAMEVGKIN